MSVQRRNRFLEIADAVEELGNAQKTVLAGGIAGVVSKTLTAPLSRMAILYQVLNMREKDLILIAN